MMYYHFVFNENQKFYSTTKETDENPLGLLPKANCPANGIRDYVRVIYEAKNDPKEEWDHSIVYDKERLSKALIEEYKKLDCYKEQTEEQRKEVIDLIKKEPLEEIEGCDID